MQSDLKNAGLFFGSFNPIHTGHLIIAEYMQQELGLEKVLFVVSPQNPFKDVQDLWSQDVRLKLVQAAIADNPRFEVCDIEFRLPKPSYTFRTLEHLKELYPQMEYSLIMGSDNLPRLKEWKHIDRILDAHKIEIYQRPNTSELEAFHPNITIHQTPLIEISATFIRKRLEQGKTVRYLVSDTVLPLLEEESRLALKGRHI